MSTTDPTCTCGHTALAHSNMPALGCLEATGDRESCTCPLSRREVQTRADDAATHQAIAQVDEHADAGWVLQATGAVMELANTGDPFTTDDVWESLAAAGAPEPREPRALGPIIQRLVKASTIYAIGYTASRRRHQAIIRIYTARDL